MSRNGGNSYAMAGMENGYGGYRAAGYLNCGGDCGE